VFFVWSKGLVHQDETNMHLSRLSLDWIERLALKRINNKFNTGDHSSLSGKHPKNNNILQSYQIFYFLLKTWFIKTKGMGKTSTTRGVFNDLVCQFRPHTVKPPPSYGRSLDILTLPWLEPTVVSDLVILSPVLYLGHHFPFWRWEKLHKSFIYTQTLLTAITIKSLTI
jgi:hypothetical protein